MVGFLGLTDSHDIGAMLNNTKEGRRRSHIIDRHSPLS
jgi:hypothetical protein